MYMRIIIKKLFFCKRRSGNGMKFVKLLLKSLLATIMCLVVCVVILGGVVVALLHTTDFAPVVERYASKATGREVTVGDIKIQWSSPLRIRIEDFHFGNAAWGTEPDMVALKSMDAVLDTQALLQGNVKFQYLSLDDLQIFLERNESGVGNWRFHDFSPSVPKDPFEHESDQRAGFPVILDAAIKNSAFRMKTSSGSMIRIDAHDLRLGAQDEHSPFLLVVDGAYNGKAAKMSLASDSYTVLQDPSTPYPVKIRIARARDTLDFEGTMTDPVNGDGARGALSLNAPDMGEILSMFGLNVRASFPVYLKTPLIRAGDRWSFENLDGKIARTNFTGKLILNEGSRAVADDLVGELNVKKLDARRIIDGVSKMKRPTQKSDIKYIPLEATKNPGMTVDISLRAGEVHYDNWHVSDAELHVKNTPGKISVEALKFSAAEGRISMDMHLDATGKTPYLKSEIDVAAVDLGRILRLAKSPDARKVINGPINARAVLNMKGQNVEQGIKNSRGGVVAYMNDGRIAKKFLELATLDLNLLFGGSKGQEKMSCLLGVYTMRNGEGRLAPLQLHAESASLTGGGTINLLSKEINIYMEPVEGTTGFLALDIPLHFSGPFSSIGIEPIVFGKSNLPKTQAVRQIPQDLLPELRSLAMRSNCVK